MYVSTTSHWWWLNHCKPPFFCCLKHHCAVLHIRESRLMILIKGMAAATTSAAWVERMKHASQFHMGTQFITFLSDMSGIGYGCYPSTSCGCCVRLGGSSGGGKVMEPHPASSQYLLHAVAQCLLWERKNGSWTWSTPMIHILSHGKTHNCKNCLRGLQLLL